MTETRPEHAESASRLRLVAVFALVFAGILLVALRQGAYDVVTRQETGLVVWWFLALGVLAGIVPRSLPAGPGRLVIGALVLLGAWSVVSLGWSADASRTLVEIVRVAMHLGVLLLVVTLLDRQTWKAAVGGAAAAGAAVCAVALGHRLAPDVFGEDVVVAAFGSNRLSAPLGYWNAVGAWAGMSSALALGLSAHVRSPVLRGLALAAVPVAIATSYLTYSRASLIGTAFGLAILVITSRNRLTLAVHGLVAVGAGVAAILTVRGAPEIARATGEAGAGRVLFALVAGALVCAAAAVATARVGADRVRMPIVLGRRVAGVVTAALALVVVVAVMTVGPTAWEQFRDTSNTQSADPAARLQSLNGSRYLIWRTAARDAEDHLLRGSGTGTFEYTWNRSAGSGEFVKDAHSLYLEPLTELGVPGLLCILLLVGGVLWTFVRALTAHAATADRGVLAAAAAATGAFFLGAGVDWLWESTAVAVLALVLVGAAIAATGGRAGRVPWPARIGLALAALVVCLMHLPAMVSVSEIRASQRAVRDGQPALALAHARDAIETEPWASAPYVQRALLRERAGAFAAAAADLRRAADRAPHDWRIPLLQARVLARAGDAPGALSAYRRARALRPQGRFFSGTASAGASPTRIPNR